MDVGGISAPPGDKALPAANVTCASDVLDSLDADIEAAENEVGRVVQSMKEVERKLCLSPRRPRPFVIEAVVDPASMSLDVVQDKFQKEMGIIGNTSIQLQDTEGTLLQNDVDLQSALTNGNLPLQAHPNPEKSEVGLSQSVDEVFSKSVDEVLGLQWRFIRETLTAVMTRMDDVTSDLRSLEGEVHSWQAKLPRMTSKHGQANDFPGPEQFALTFSETLVPLTEKVASVARVITTEREARESLALDVNQRLDRSCEKFDLEVEGRRTMADKLWKEIESLREAVGKAPVEALRPTSDEAHVEAMMAAHADEARDHSQALQKLSEGVTEAIEAHSRQILRATADVNRLGKELTSRIVDLEVKTQDTHAKIEGLQSKLSKSLEDIGDQKSEVLSMLNNTTRLETLANEQVKSVTEKLACLDGIFSSSSPSGQISKGKGFFGVGDSGKGRQDTNAGDKESKAHEKREAPRERQELSPGRRVMTTPTPVVPLLCVPQVRPPSPLVIVSQNVSSQGFSQGSRSPSPSPSPLSSPLASPKAPDGRSGALSPFRMTSVEGQCSSAGQISPHAPLMSPTSMRRQQLVNICGLYPYGPAVQPVQLVPGHSITPVRMRPAVVTPVPLTGVASSAKLEPGVASSAKLEPGDNLENRKKPEEHQTLQPSAQPSAQPSTQPRPKPATSHPPGRSKARSPAQGGVRAAAGVSPGGNVSTGRRQTSPGKVPPAGRKNRESG